MSQRWKRSAAITVGSLAVLVASLPAVANPTIDPDYVSTMDLVRQISDGAGEEQQKLLLGRLSSSRFARIGSGARETIDANYEAFMPLFVRYQHPGCARQVDLQLHDWFMVRANAEQNSAMRAMLRMWLLAPEVPACPYLPEGVDPEPIQLGDRVTAAELLSDLRDTESVPLIAALVDSIRHSAEESTSRGRAVCRHLELAQARIEDPASAAIFVVAPGGGVRMTRNAADFEQFLVNHAKDFYARDIVPILEALQRAGKYVERVRVDPRDAVVTLVFPDGARASMAAWEDDCVLLADNLRSRPNALVVQHKELRSAIVSVVARTQQAKDEALRRTAN